jgi:ubiquitin carboxyl-terminal hydrolase 2/21
MDKFVENEILDDVYCSKCQKLRRVEKNLKFYRLPKVLVIHLKRFSQLNDKLLDEVNFEDVIDLKKYVDTQSSLHIPQDPPLYTLTGVTKHIGSVRGGHYTAECKHSETGEWLSFNDSTVNKSKHRISSSDYVMFYVRNNKSR